MARGREVAKGKGIASGIERQRVREEHHIANCLAQVIMMKMQMKTRIKDPAT